MLRSCRFTCSLCDLRVNVWGGQLGRGSWALRRLLKSPWYTQHICWGLTRTLMVYLWANHFTCLDNSYTVTCMVVGLAPDSPAGGVKNGAIVRWAWGLWESKKFGQWRSHSTVLSQGLQCCSTLLGHAPLLAFICEPTHN